ncbi:unnamed protein product [Calicophoron daubneyi]|uniref:RRM domain-containing protein n=1 Tax=Calicophoron daubneyi TaxID=300641 RepID=A0AAV2TK28_CALDB
MGRSKQIQSPSSGKPATAKATPAKSPAKSETPAKIGVKRPLPSNSDESEEEVLGSSVADLLKDGIPQKKGKFVNAVDESESDEGVDENETEDDDDDDSEEEEEQGSEEDDDDDDEDDESEEESEAGEKSPEMLTPKKPAATTKQSVAPGKTKSPATLTPKTHLPPSRSSISKLESGCCFLASDPPQDIKQLTDILSTQGCTITNIRKFQKPVVFFSVESKECAEKLLAHNLSAPVSNLHLLQLCGSNEALVAFSTTKSLRIIKIPKSCTIDFLKSHLPNGINPATININRFNDAHLNFESVEEAVLASEALSSVVINGQPLDVRFVQDLPDVPNELRGSTRTLATHLPAEVTESQVRNLFTTATNIRMVRGKRGGIPYCMIDFKDSAAAVAAFDAHAGHRFGEYRIDLRFVPQLDHSPLAIEVGGVPYDSKPEEVIKAFPGAISATQIKKGSFNVKFSSIECLKSAISGSRKIGGRDLHVFCYGGVEQNIVTAKNLPFSATEKDVREAYPTAKKITIHYRPNGQASGSATIEFPSAAECQKQIAAVKTVGPRRVFLSLERVPIQTTQLNLKQKNQVKQTQAEKGKNAKGTAPPQVGSASEDSSAEEDVNMKEDKCLKSKAHSGKSKSEDDDSEDGSDDDEEDEEDDDDEDEDEDEDEDVDEDSEDGAEASSDEEVQVKQKPAKKQGQQEVQSDNGKKGQNNFRQDGPNHQGFRPRGGRGDGFNKFRGGRGGGRGNFRENRGGRGGFRGRGNFNRGRGDGNRGRGDGNRGRRGM